MGKRILVIAVFPTAQTDKIAVNCVTVWAQHKSYFPLLQNYVPLQKNQNRLESRPNEVVTNPIFMKF